MGKFYTVEVKPTIAASIQHAEAFASGELLFDWTEFEVPKGTVKLINTTIMIRPKGDAGPTANSFAGQLIFSKTNTQSLGTPGANPVNIPSNDFLGMMSWPDQGSVDSHPGTWVITAPAGGDTDRAGNGIIMTPTEKGANVGYSKMYLGAFAAGAFTFESINAIAEAGAAEAASTQVITMDGSSMDVREHFIDGDVVHIGTSVGSPAADSLIGTVASADNATQITLDAVSPTALVDGDILYNIHPIRVILQFECS